MTDRPENVALEFLGQQMAKLLTEMAAMRSEMTEMRTGLTGMQGNIVTLSETSGKTIDALLAIGKDVEQLKSQASSADERLELIEGRLNTIDGRLARIERHTGLVKV